MRRTIPVLIVALLWPAAAGARTPTLTLKAPTATTYGHRIEFVGRLTPASPGAHVRLLRGKGLVTTGRVRGDGTFRIPVRIERPGPFHATWLTAESNDVIVRIHPRLDARLVGSHVVGAPLRLVAAVTPTAAAAIRVQVFRDGRPSLDRRFHGKADLALGTRDLAALHVRVTTAPKPGYAAAPSQNFRAQLLPPTLAVGATSLAVAELARRLAALHYAVPSVSTSFSDDFVQSVYAFQKVQGLERTGAVDKAFWARLASPKIPRPRYALPAEHIEVDKTHQVLYLVRDGRIAMISPVSTGGIAGYYTPEGRFAIYRKVVGYDPSPLGTLLNPMYFTGGYAIHGNPSVPPYPASHGCIRVPNFVIYRLFSSEPYGETVYVYS